MILVALRDQPSSGLARTLPPLWVAVLVDGMSGDAAQNKTNLCACSRLPPRSRVGWAGPIDSEMAASARPDRKRGGLLG